MEGPQDLTNKETFKKGGLQGKWEQFGNKSNT
jgi:hypothetical protein